MSEQEELEQLEQIVKDNNARVANYKPLHHSVVFAELEKAFGPMTADEIGRWFLDYMLESNHQGFEGFSNRDLTGIRNLVRDMLLHRDACLKDEPEYFSRKWSNGMRTW